MEPIALVDKHPALSTKPNGANEPSADLRALCQLSLQGQEQAIRELAAHAVRLERETIELRRQLRKQELDFSTLFEIVGQSSARALDLVSMQTYIMRTVSGHFMAPRLLISRRMRDEDAELTASAAQGLRNVHVTIPLESPLCDEAMKEQFCFFLKDLPGSVKELPEVASLLEHDLELAVPLIQEVEAPETVLEGFIFLGQRMANRAYTEQNLDFLHILGKMLAICMRNEALYRRSIIDDLTGVASRGHFDARLSQEINRIQIYGHRSIGLVLLDVDFFKSFNDQYGHQTGDKVLQELARVMVHQVRNVDLVARYGGEEFAIILLEIDHQRVLEVAERLRGAVERMAVSTFDGKELRITASFGAACFPDDADSKWSLIQKADEALYVAKDRGRNQVIMASAAKALKAPKPAAKPPILEKPAPESYEGVERRGGA